MARFSEVSRYGNTMRHRIKSSSNTRPRRDRYAFKEDEYADDESVLFGASGGRRASADVKRDIEKLELERRKETEEREKLQKESEFQEEMRKRLKTLGYNEKAISELVGQSKTPAKRPIYRKVHKQYLAIETLKYYDIPWKYDRNDPNYIIVLRKMSNDEVNLLYEHTSRLRAGKLLLEPEPRKEYAFYRRRTGRNVVGERIDHRRQEAVRPEPRRFSDPQTYEEAQPLEPELVVEAVPVAESTAAEGPTGDDDPFRDDLILEADEPPPALDFDLDFSSSEHLSDNEPPTVSSDGTTAGHDSSASLQIEAPLDIVESKWLGSPLDSWELGAQLKALSTPPNKKTRKVTKWYHVQRNMMNFEEFIAIASEALHLEDSKKTLVRSILLQTQAEKERPRQHGRQMEAICVAYNDSKETDGQKKQAMSVAFVSFPMFSLEKEAENGIQTLAGGAMEHPSRPLVASRSRSSQAVASLPITPDGFSWHTTDLWCLVVNHDTLITSSKSSRKTLRGKLLTKQDINFNDIEEVVQVQLSQGRKWQVPLRDLRNGPSLASLFTEHITTVSGPAALASFQHNRKSIDLASLGDLLGRNPQDKRSAFELTLSVPTTLDAQAVKDETMQRARAFIMGDPHLQAETTTLRDPSANRKSGTHPKAPMRLFQHSNGGSLGDLTNFADSLHRACSENSQRSAREAYQACPEGTQKHIEVWLGKYKEWKNGDLGKDVMAILSTKENIAVLSHYAFAFFWPLDFDHILVRKFWGALDLLLDGDDFYCKDEKRPYVTRMIADLFFETMYELLIPTLVSLASVLSGHEDSLRPLPKPFAKAWLYFMSAFLLAATGMKQNWKTPLHYFSMAAEQLNAGDKAITQNFRGDLVLEDYEVCSTRDIAAFLLDNVSRDMLHNTPLDIAATYEDYYQKLEEKIEGDPTNRAHQSTIRTLRQELFAISKVLAQQLEIVETFKQSIDQLYSADASQQPLLPSLSTPTRQATLLKRLINHLNTRLDKFSDLQTRLNELSYQNMGDVENNKDRQEAAILVFTIVTIIFLPLSFVASVLGMNTSDIRNMDQKQWVFWVVAVPLTVIVMGGSLWFAGALEGLRGRTKGEYEDESVTSGESYDAEVKKKHSFGDWPGFPRGYRSRRPQGSVMGRRAGSV